MKIISKLLPIIIILLIGCSIDRTVSRLNESDQNLLTEFRQIDTANRLKITNENESGEKLTLCITLVDKAHKKPLANQKIHFYHTSNEGEYEPQTANDESSARLSGTAISDLKGRVYVETILPGDYGSSADNRHIHTTIFGAKPEGYDIHFKQYTGLIGKNFAESSDQHFLADLKKDGSGNLITFITIEAKFPES